MDKNGNPHQPITFAVNMCTFFAEFSRQGVPYALKDFLNYQGYFSDIQDQVWKEYMKHDKNFGKK